MHAKSVLTLASSAPHGVWIDGQESPPTSPRIAFSDEQSMILTEGGASTRAQIAQTDVVVDVIAQPATVLSGETENSPVFVSMADS